MKKGFLLAILAVSLVCFLSGMALADQTVAIKINEMEVNPEEPAQVVNGVTMVPLRFISEALGADVGWSNSTNTAIVRKDFYSEVDINTPLVKVESKDLKLEVNGKLLENISLIQSNDRVMVPLRVISENLGAQVEWDGTAKTVAINYTDSSQKSHALDLLIKAQDVLMNDNSYTFSGSGITSIKGNSSDQNQNGEMKIAVSMDGVCESPTKMYFVMKMTPQEMTGIEEDLESLEEMQMEMILDGDVLYMNAGDGLWEKQEGVLNGQQYLEQFDPEYYKELMEKMDIQLTFGDEEVIDGKNYIVLKGNMDGMDVLKIMDEYGLGSMNNLSGLPEDDSLSEEDSEMIEEQIQMMMKQIFENLSAEYIYYIDAETLALYRTVSKVNIEMVIPEMEADIPAEEEETSSVSIEAVYDIIYSPGKSMEIPVITEDMLKPGEEVAE